tara:strand:+ start:4843 stop:5481 length:639 start_codon:yes stop_codon:yes gene_type:complete
MTQTISKEQLKQNQELHSKRPDFGSRGGAGNKVISLAIKRFHELKLVNSVLDYGTGKGAYPKSLKKLVPSLKVGAYDPAVEKFNKRPKRAYDLLTCFDVLEHVERDSVSAVLQDIKDLSVKIAYLQIDLQPAVKRLSSGKNAHIMLAPTDWWLAQVSPLFPVLGSFPIYHNSGTIQKVGIVVTANAKYGSIVWSLLAKLQTNPITISGGYLG